VALIAVVVALIAGTTGHAAALRQVRVR